MAKRRRKVEFNGNEYSIIPISKGRDIKKEQKIEMAKLVCAMYATDEYSLVNCLKAVGINSDVTWYNWQNEIEEIEAMYKEAFESKSKIYFHRLVRRARTSLEKRVDGEVIELKVIKVRKPNKTELNNLDFDIELVREEITKEVYIPPSDTAIQFALTNQDAINFERNPSPDDKIIDDIDIDPIEWVK